VSEAPPVLIGVTGNIGAGKSTVGRMLGSLGAEVIDADRIAHAVMHSGTPVFEELTEAFGQTIIGPDGEIDRRGLAAIVFVDPTALARLEAIVHPATVRAIEQRIADSSAVAVVVEAIKLIEAGLADTCESVWVVTSTSEQQIERAVARGMALAEAERRIQSQSTQDEKVAHADVVIDNSGSLHATCAQVTAAWNRLAPATGANEA